VLNKGAILALGLALVFAIVILMATLRTKARQRRIRKALGLPARMGTSSAEAQARHAVRAFEQTDLRLTTTARRLSREERRKMAGAIVREKGFLPTTKRRRRRSAG
jgi:hypothetical protein